MSAWLKSDNIIILLVGTIFAILLTFIPSITTINQNEFIRLYILLIIIIMIISAFLWAFNRRTNEIKDELDSQKLEQKKLGEKLKIHEQLIDIKSELKELQKKVFKK